MPLLENHIAAITGAGSGIGRAIALGYAREGARVVVLDVNGEAASETVQQILTAGGKAEAFPLDVTDREACRAMAKKIADEVGQVSILVNNAGINRRNAFTGDPDAVVKDWQDIIAINLNGVFNVTHAFLGRAARHQGAHRQHRLDPVVHARAHAELARLHHLEARRARLHPGARGRTRQGRRARQRDRPGPDRNAAQRGGARQQSGTDQDLHGPHAARPRRQAGRHRGTGDLPRLRPLGLCHRRDRDGGRRLSDGLMRAFARRGIALFAAACVLSLTALARTFALSDNLKRIGVPTLTFKPPMSRAHSRRQGRSGIQPKMYRRLDR